MEISFRESQVPPNEKRKSLKCMASLNALSLTKHRRAGFAPKGEPALTHVPLQPPLEALLLTAAPVGPSGTENPALPRGKV